MSRQTLLPHDSSPGGREGVHQGSMHADRQALQVSIPQGLLWTRVLHETQLVQARVHFAAHLACYETSYDNPAPQCTLLTLTLIFLTMHKLLEESNVGPDWLPYAARKE